ncbi:MAG: hypothetical protein ABIH88_00100 [Patescibacteria group bacterium]|nr:hypothetical protein [Patescibacteria group bacterium]
MKKEKWLSLLKRQKTTKNSENIYKDLLLRYKESHRRYHNLSHLKECFVEFEKVAHLLKNPDSVEMAIWYHDAIYNPKKQDNEEKSAMLFLKNAKELCLSDIFKKDISQLILETKHQKPPKENDAKFLIDIDLSILGKNKKRFEKYEEQIREEYCFVPKKEFNQKRKAFLESLLKRQNIYSTSFFKDKYERKTRENLANSINLLKTSS